MATTLKDRVNSRLDALKISATEAARRAKLDRGFVLDIINGRKKSIRGDNLRRLAKVLGCDESYLTGTRDDPTRPTPFGNAPLPVIGVAEAGAFREMPGFGDERSDADFPQIVAPRSRLYPAARHFALQVRGDSMDAAKPKPILEGTYVLCVDLVSAELEIETGRIYAVRRTLDAGHTWEWTIKRAHVFRSRIELRPESRNPQHHPVTIDRHHDTSETIEVRAIGLVYATFDSFE